MKKLICFITLFVSILSFSFEKDKNSIKAPLDNTREVNLTSSALTNSQFTIFPKSEKNIPPFNLKLFIKDKKKLEQFISASLGILDLKSPTEVSIFLKKGSEGLFFESFFKEGPLLSEFLFRSLKKPESIAKFLSLFFQFNKLIFFSILMIASFIFSHFLGEFQFQYEALSLQRMSFGMVRFGIINMFRFASFSLLFQEHLKPSMAIFVESVSVLAPQYPIIHALCGLF